MVEFNSIAGYEVVSTLGYGARSVIFKVRDSHNNLFALKRVVKSSASDQRFVDQVVSEHQIASRFNHPALRRSYKLIRDRGFVRTRGVVVIMELVEGRTLEQYQPATMLEAIEIFRRAAEGLAAMHAENFVHADIKPTNIMITHEGQVKLIDFGQSCAIGTVKERIQGTPDYIAPEQVRRQPITIRTDVFNLGATMYWALTRRHVPTVMPKKGQVGTRIQLKASCAPPMELNSDVPAALSSLIMDCIEQGPHARPESMEQVIFRLEIAADQIRREQHERFVG